MAYNCVECLSVACLSQSCGGPNRILARYIYGFIFLLTNLIAWMVRDYSHKAIATLDHYFKGNREGGHNYLHSEGVLRVSLGCFIFFFVMYLTTVGTSRIDDPRDAWHSGWWPVKSLLWMLLMILPFFIPSSFIQIYGDVARFGAGIFLVIQLLSIIDFIYWWNEDWLSERKAHLYRAPLVFVTTMAYIISIVAIILMYIWFAPHVSCRLNIFFITWTFVLILMGTIISLHPKVNAGLMTSGLVALYLVFLCWSAIMSEPATSICNTVPRQTGRGDWLTIISFLIAVLAIVLATFSTGMKLKSFSKPKDQPEANDVTPYGYGFFHFVFAMGSMYFAMLFVGWNLHQTMHKWSIDVGWASVWVKIVNEWLAVSVYIWTMICVFVLKDRDFT